jgi:hypothetical protein
MDQAKDPATNLQFSLTPCRSSNEIKGLLFYLANRMEPNFKLHLEPHEEGNKFSCLVTCIVPDRTMVLTNVDPESGEVSETEYHVHLTHAAARFDFDIGDEIDKKHNTLADYLESGLRPDITDAFEELSIYGGVSTVTLEDLLFDLGAPTDQP